MSVKLYVGSLAYQTTEQELHELFSQHGTVISAKIVEDRATGGSRGFGFVEMTTQEEAMNAITGLHGFTFSGRSLVVNEARPPGEKPQHGGRGRKSY